MQCNLQPALLHVLRNTLTPNIPSTAIVCVAVAEPPLMYMESAGGLKVTVAVYWPVSEVVMGWKVREAV